MQFAVGGADTEPVEARVPLSADVRGRIVKLLARERVLQGWHSVVWDGTSDTGRRVPSGIYLLRFEARSVVSNERFDKTTRLLMIR